MRHSILFQWLLQNIVFVVEWLPFLSHDFNSKMFTLLAKEERMNQNTTRWRQPNRMEPKENNWNRTTINQTKAKYICIFEKQKWFIISHNTLATFRMNIGAYTIFDMWYTTIHRRNSANCFPCSLFPSAFNIYNISFSWGLCDFSDQMKFHWESMHSR